jgi:large subunit ribosomal protein L29
MKTKDLRSMSKVELNSKLTELRKELIKHNAQISTGTTPKSPGQVREIKKTIAKIMTVVGAQGASKLEDKKSSSVSTQEAGKAPKSSEEKKVEEKPAPKTEEKNNG